jgi:acetyltransferase-like isoleucine patch superfamily enzyme
MGVKQKLRGALRPKWWWAVFWMRMAGLGRWGRFASRMAAWSAPPYKGSRFLANLHPLGYVSHRARIAPGALHRVGHGFVGDGVTVYQVSAGSGTVILGERSSLHQDTLIELGAGGTVEIGANTHIQPGCLLAAYVAPIRLGSEVQVAAGCRFYSYNHGFAKGTAIAAQPLTSKGGITLEDDVWLGAGVTVLDGVTIGRGAVVGAGALVVRDVPPGAIAAGVPAKVVRYRE